MWLGMFCIIMLTDGVSSRKGARLGGQSNMPWRSGGWATRAPEPDVNFHTWHDVNLIGRCQESG